MKNTQLSTNQLLYLRQNYSMCNDLTPTVATCVPLYSILCQTGLSRHL